MARGPRTPGYAEQARPRHPCRLAGDRDRLDLPEPPIPAGQGHDEGKTSVCSDGKPLTSAPLSDPENPGRPARAAPAAQGGELAPAPAPDVAGVSDDPGGSEHL